MTGRLSSLSRSIDGRVAVVTGAGSGMGRATAYLFADEGARVAICDLNPDGLEETRATIAGRYGDDRVLAMHVDVGRPEEIGAFVTSAADVFGGIDIVVNNAGMASPNPIDPDTFGDDDFTAAWNRTLDVNLSSLVFVVRAALPHLRRSDAARIVNIASTEAIVSTPWMSAYSATKAGVTGLTRSMAVEFGKDAITVNCICPGPIDTGMTAGIPDDAKAVYARRRVALRRYADPEEVAQMTLSLCLPAASFVTGATIPVDGGMTVRHT